jgi:hypothetical protein
MRFVLVHTVSDPLGDDFLFTFIDGTSTVLGQAGFVGNNRLVRVNNRRCKGLYFPKS